MQEQTPLVNPEMTRQFEEIWDESNDPETIKKKKLQKNREKYGSEFH